jgi:hypothetical protein
VLSILTPGFRLLGFFISGFELQNSIFYIPKTASNGALNTQRHDHKDINARQLSLEGA